MVSCGPETLIKNYTTHMTGLDATARALETAKGIVDMAQAEASGAVVARGKAAQAGSLGIGSARKKEVGPLAHRFSVIPANGYTPPTNLWFHIMTPRAHTAQFNHIAADMHDHQCSLHLHQASLVPFASLSERTVAS